ncbi:hypothetical protein FRC07_007122 [Ceratobasidium sp. 392]|nr:hypothetical protein FRC07_007122 [Ceratobasidium sp. 392]
MNKSKTTKAVPPQDIIALAESKYYIGRFIVNLENVYPHPQQRLVDEDWVLSLLEEFQKGVDRAAHPIKVLLSDDADWEAHAIPIGFTVTGAAPRLPSGIRLWVHHGQHRVQACKRLPSQDEHWWFADVYSQKLEKHHPAEFLSMMHAGNDSPMRLKSRDVDRFLGILQLLRLREQGRISLETFQANKDRLAGQVDSVKRGLNNLTRDLALADALGAAMQHPQLRPTFHAASWRKITKGRFYQARELELMCLSLVADLISEMEQQFLLLRDSDDKISSEPFQIAARACPWGVLQQNLKAKDHPWHGLPGGPVASLKRVRTRPAAFKTKLNPEGDWTFPDVILMPSVLTSQVVTDALENMYHLAQHLIHMIAGPSVLEQYTSNVIAVDKPQDPAGIIAMVNQDVQWPGVWFSAQGKGPTLSYGCQLRTILVSKVIRAIWCSRTELKQELLAQGVGDPALSTLDDYQRLIQRFSSWWQIMKLFKIKTFTTGLRLTIPSHAEPEAWTTSESSTALIHKQEPIAPNASIPGPAQLLQPISHAEPSSVEPQGDDARVVKDSGDTAPLLPSCIESNPMDVDISGDNLATTSSMCAGAIQQDFKSRKAIPSQKQPRSPEHSKDDAKDVVLGDQKSTDRVLTSAEVPSDQLSRQHLLVQAWRLADMSATMSSREATMIADLLQGLLNLKQEGTMSRVADSLCRQLAQTTKRAAKSAEEWYDDFEDME